MKSIQVNQAVNALTVPVFPFLDSLTLLASSLQDNAGFAQLSSGCKPVWVHWKHFKVRFRFSSEWSLDSFPSRRQH